MEINQINEQIEYYEKKEKIHEIIGYIALFVGSILALSGLYIFSNYYSIELPSKGKILERYLKELQIKASKLEAEKEPLDKIELKFFFPDIKDLDSLVKEKRKSDEEYYSRKDFAEVELIKRNILKDREFNKGFKVEIKSPYLTERYEKVTEEIKSHEKYRNDQSDYWKYFSTIESLEMKKYGLENLQLEITKNGLQENEIYKSIRALEREVFEIDNYYRSQYSHWEKNKNYDTLRKLLILEHEEKIVKAKIKNYENQISELNDKEIKASDYILLYAQIGFRLGALFLVETIAFFFLRQFRLSLDESRYYNQLSNENKKNKIALLLLNDNKYKNYQKEILDFLLINKYSSKLMPGESTEILEGKKLSQEELGLLSKVADLIGKVVRK